MLYSQEPLIILQNVTLRYFMIKRDLKSIAMNLAYRQPIVKIVEVLKNISFEVKRGELICIGGANGCGKSTLLYAICQKMEIATGTIEVYGSIFAFLGSAPK